MKHWVTIEKHTNYAVNENGKIKNKSTGQILKPIKMNNGYQKVNIKNDSTKEFKTALIHRLVCSAFGGKKKPEVDHIDRNKNNNSASNLRFVSHAQNMKNRGKSKTG